MTIMYFEILLAISSLLLVAATTSETCDKKDFFFTIHSCDKSSAQPQETTYILYDVNPGEGFNLRRDVYIRLAVFTKNLRKKKGYENTKLVLPPFSDLYHWRSYNIDQQHLFWNHFFDMQSMKSYTHILDMYEFFTELKRLNLKSKKLILDEVYRLQHFDNMFENGVFVDKFEETACRKTGENGGGRKLYFGYPNITENKLACMSFQGSAMLLYKVLEQRKTSNSLRTVLFMNAETVLHDFWGNQDYWQARRSMRFNKRLVEIANIFRLEAFNSSNIPDKVQRPKLWTEERPFRKARGGEYLCAHLRRADFLHGREKTTPSLHSAALQVKTKLLELGLRKVFISSDCSKSEFNDLKNYLKRYKVVRYTPETYEQKSELKDGGIAIVDQIICSHARYFIGTYESTFTYRIYEEREILGFPKDLTFNTFCKTEDQNNCEKNSVWPIVY